MVGGEAIRYPGVARMLLFWSVIGALNVARYQLPFGKAGPGRESLLGLIACASWYLPWGILSTLVFRLERRWRPVWIKQELVFRLMWQKLQEPFKSA